MPKVAGHGEDVLYRHASVLPGWIMAIFANPHGQYEVYTLEGAPRTILTARVEEVSEDVIVNYAWNEPDAPSPAMAIRIDRAGHLLKPFVDAILAKYGLKQEEEAAGN